MKLNKRMPPQLMGKICYKILQSYYKQTEKSTYIIKNPKTSNKLNRIQTCQIMQKENKLFFKMEE